MRQVDMFTSHIPRRDFLATLVGAAGVASFARPAAASSSAAYDPGAKFEVKMTEVEFRRNNRPDAC